MSDITAVTKVAFEILKTAGLFDATSELIDRQFEKLSKGIYRFIELMIWMALSVVPSTLIISFSSGQPKTIFTSYFEHPIISIYSSVVIIFPLSYMLVFGSLPLEHFRLRRALQQNSQDAVRDMSSSADDNEIKRNFLKTMPVASIASIGAAQILNPRELLAHYANRSAETASDIYRRSGVYLVIGVVIALLGVAFLYFRTYDIPVGASLLENLSMLAPTFGILFFVEFVAIFFLRQHRIAMDDFRHYEQIRRNREENLIILKMFDEFKTVVPTKDVLQAMTFYSSPAFLGKDQTSEFVETRKLLKDEIAVFDKLLDIMSQLKKETNKDKSEKKE